MQSFGATYRCLGGFDPLFKLSAVLFISAECCRVIVLAATRALKPFLSESQFKQRRYFPAVNEITGTSVDLAVLQISHVRDPWRGWLGANGRKTHLNGSKPTSRALG